ncbi:anaphase-promoting complex, cyclosome, subunit 3-domain-containing protein, partial [Ochromonadaceae sp. CCMP2298]
MGRSESEVLLHRLACKYLSSHLLDAALFYAERLHSEVPSADSLHLLALCYFRLGKTKQSYLILHDNVHSASPANKYLFALACCKLDKLEEGEQVLRPLKPRPGPLTLEQVRNTPGGAEGVFLLGRICRRQHRKDAATACFKLSLAMDPYLWSAVAELGEMG